MKGESPYRLDSELYEKTKEKDSRGRVFSGRPSGNDLLGSPENQLRLHSFARFGSLKLHKFSSFRTLCQITPGVTSPQIERTLIMTQPNHNPHSFNPQPTCHHGTAPPIAHRRGVPREQAAIVLNPTIIGP